jgi:nucleoside diphosphate kinase
MTEGRNHPWYGYVFAFVSPDGIARRLATPVVERVLGAGFAVEYCQIVNVGPDQLDAAFAHDTGALRNVYRYRILDLLFGYGPALAIVFRDLGRDLRNAGDPYQRLKALKGATSPVEAVPGTIRADLGAINTILGLVHASDSPEDTAEEAALFLRDAIAGDRPPSGDPARGTDGRSLPMLLRLLDAGPAAAGEFQAVLAGHRARVLAACFTDLSAAARGQVLAALGDPLGEIGAGAAIAAGLRGGPDHPAWSLLTAEWQPGLPSLGARSTAVRLAALGLTVDPWEELVLRSSAHFAPVRRSAARGSPGPAHLASAEQETNAR